MIYLFLALFSFGLIYWHRIFFKGQSELQEKYLVLNLDLAKKQTNKIEGLHAILALNTQELNVLRQYIIRPLPPETIVGFAPTPRDLKPPEPASEKDEKREKRKAENKKRKAISERTKARWASYSPEKRKSIVDKMRSAGSKRKKAAPGEQPQQEGNTKIATEQT
jgi:hypothetical protein